MAFNNDASGRRANDSGQAAADSVSKGLGRGSQIVRGIFVDKKPDGGKIIAKGQSLRKHCRNDHKRALGKDEQYKMENK